MGQHADDVLEGVCCGECMSFFEEENGFPALCFACWDEDKSTRNQDGVNADGFQRSNYPVMD